MPTGYGPSLARLVFDGNEENFELWEVKFKAYLRTRKLLSILNGDHVSPNKFAEMNALMYAELVQLLVTHNKGGRRRRQVGNGDSSRTLLREV